MTIYAKSQDGGLQERRRGKTEYALLWPGRVPVPTGAAIAHGPFLQDRIGRVVQGLKAAVSRAIGLNEVGIAEMAGRPSSIFLPPRPAVAPGPVTENRGTSTLT